MTYHFMNNRSDVLLMAREDCIFKIDFEKIRVKKIYQFKIPLDMQPRIFITNSDQSIYLISSAKNCIYYNSNTGDEVHMNTMLDIELFQNACYDHEEKMFYLCCNR